MGFFIFVLFILVIILFFKNSGLRHRIDKLEEQIRDITAREAYLAKKQRGQEKETPVVEPIKAPFEIPASKAPDNIPVSGPTLEPAYVYPDNSAPKSSYEPLKAPAESTTPGKQDGISETIKKPETAYIYRGKTEIVAPYMAKEADQSVKIPPPKSEFLAKLEKQLLENWTGILGAVVMVMGVGFLGIYAALVMVPVFRFLMIAGFGSVLLGLGIFAGKKEKWSQMATWLRSSAAAIILFSCLGAGGIPGLQWIDNHTAALGLLLAGIAINLYTGFSVGRQFAVSFHTILSLVALGIAPQSPMTLGLAAAVTVLSIILTRRAQWEYHLLVTITSFMIYHAAWYFMLGHPSASAMSMDMRATGIGAVLITGSVTAFIHYNSLYKDQRFEVLPFTVHLANWFYMALGFIVYATGTKWNTIILVFAALSVFIMSRFAKRLRIEWLHVTDVLIAQSIMLFAVYTLNRWDLNIIEILAIFMAETLVFLYMMVREDMRIGKYIGTYLYHISWIGFIGWSAVLLYRADGTYPSNDSALMLAVLTVGLLINCIFEKTKHYIDSFSWYGGVSENEISIGGIFTGTLGLLLYLCYHNNIWAGFAFAALSITLMAARQAFQSKGLGIGLIIMNVFSYLALWANLLNGSFSIEGWSRESAVLLYSMPFLVNAFALMLFSYIREQNKRYVWPVFYLLSMHCAIAGYCALIGISAFAPGVAWLVLSVIFLQTSPFISRRDADQINSNHLLINGLIFICIFLIRYVLVDMQSHLYAGPIPARLAVALLSIAAFLYWGLFRLNERAWSGLKTVQQIIWELIIVVSLLATTLEFSDFWPGIALTSAAFILLSAGGLLSQISGLRSSALPIALIAGYMIAWYYFLTSHYSIGAWTRESAVLLHSIPFYAIALALIFFSRIHRLDRSYIWAAIYILSVHSAVISYCASVHISDFIPGVCWLLLSLVFLHSSLFLSGRAKDQSSAMHLMINGLLFIIIFLVRHVLVHIQSHLHMGPIPVRLAISLFAVAVFVYWALARLNESAWIRLKTLHQLLWEIIIIFSRASAIIELSDAWFGIIFTSAAFVLLAIGSSVASLSRFRLYSLLMALAAAFSIGFISSTYMTPSVLWEDQGWIIGCGAILIYFGFLFAFRRNSNLSAISPGPFSRMDSLAGRMDRRQNAILFYPFFVALALFTFWSFDSSLLTLLWVAEAFVIFVLSIVFKEQHFRYISMAGLVGCLGRLVFYDLSKSTTITRAIVFLGVGIIMLVMNSLYNKYRDRYNK